MKNGRLVRLAGFFLILLGAMFFAHDFTLTGFSIIDKIPEGQTYIISLALIATGALLTLYTTTEEKRHYTARKRLVDLLEGRLTNVSTDSSFNLVDRYQHVSPAGYQIVHGRKHRKYEGVVKKEYGGGTEEFTVDKGEAFEMHLPGGRSIGMPSHIDVQDGKNHHHRIDIPWRAFLEGNADLLVKYHVTPDSMLSSLEHRRALRKKAA